MSQSHGTAIWTEPAGSGAVPTPTQMVLKLVDGAWQHVAGSSPDAITVDLGDGAFTIIDVTTEYFLVDDGAGGWDLSATGPAAAVLVAAGDGAMVPTAIGTGVVQAARFYADSAGTIYAVQLAADQLEFVQVRGIIQSY